ncbi:class I SAM-dependent methyltransferase [Marinobacter sp. M3C]|uniref:class I SAM-dependent methyltransferase n=1 Tax=unclassified Marinobacter TaxID=83889 RepID=UPI0020101B0A|nr:MULTISPECIES: class I SAM-dependent methyltransferase [unclassified Marinobacter]UQG55903.1 class I SAM-dependent methyltransferase [Marinobacter sp. M4C]UQG58556.1 class I SAM-dependent methyltransferase [Marinobacter sp. M3C]UQG64708.1 class I SAM-dependent methyltransferase [Marinobacter sp. M2C]UQG68986.1 class I SAM-dependent methyltransferase [Marinobacter sp. M1C]
MDLANVVPWGRSFDEYQKMFGLSEADLNKRILGCGDGPASFNAEATKRGYQIISCDPVYQFEVQEIRRRIDDVYPEIMGKMQQNADSYIWDSLGSVKQLGEVRMKAMSRFLSDFDVGRRQGRYVSASLPTLPFSDSEFDLALCSHFLFLYSDQVDEAAHLESMQELCRVASEVRVFPVISLDGKTSKHLDSVMTALSADGIAVSLQPVSYRFQKGATEMLVAKSV